MRRVRVAAIPAALLLASCASVTEVVPVGQDTFMVSGSDRAFKSTGNEMMVELYKAANKHCVAMDKLISPVSSTSQNWTMDNASSAELYFRCLAPGDPELRRPAFGRTPDTVIEVIQK